MLRVTLRPGRLGAILVHLAGIAVAAAVLSGTQFPIALASPIHLGELNSPVTASRLSPGGWPDGWAG
jgi:hypothetical protein